MKTGIEMIALELSRHSAGASRFLSNLRGPGTRRSPCATSTGAIAIAATLLAGCAGDAPNATPDPALSAQRPISLSAPQGALGQAGETQSVAATSVRADLPIATRDKAVSRTLLSLGKSAERQRSVGADLDGDGTPEIVVFLEGEDFCARTGCTLIVLRRARAGYRTVSRTLRVRPPVVALPGSGLGWRTLGVRTGLPGQLKRVALPFGGSGYPKNASIASAAAMTGGEVLIAATRDEQTAAVGNSDLIANQN
ncbi:MAG: hypothetical protein AAFQ42_12610 [Pseudomonadota bacterium]